MTLEAWLASWLGETIAKLLVQVFLGWISQLERDDAMQQKGRQNAQNEAVSEEEQLAAKAAAARADAGTGGLPDHGHWRD